MVWTSLLLQRKERCERKNRPQSFPLQTLVGKQSPTFIQAWVVPDNVANSLHCAQQSHRFGPSVSVSAIFLLLVSPGGHSNCSHLESNNGESELAERASLMASLLPPHRSARIKDIHLRYNYGYGLSKRSPLPGSFLFVFSRFALDGPAVVF